MSARLLGYVSDERYLALSDVAVEISGDGEVWQARSSPGGAIRADVPPGSYRVTLARDGYGAKHVDADLDAEPYQFRMVSDRILGYVWPKWTVSGELSEFRVHSPEPYRLSLRRYGADVEPETLIGWYDEHAPRATVPAPERGGLYYSHADGESGAHFSFPWVIAPRSPRSDIAVLASTNTWNAYNNFGGRSNYINAVGLPPPRPRWSPAWSWPATRSRRSTSTHFPTAPTRRCPSNAPNRSTRSAPRSGRKTRSAAGSPATSLPPSGD